jgi:uncharacterized membrane protein YkvA (DUF1232 family)
MWKRLKAWARSMKREVHALWLSARDRRTPWYAKAVALAIAAYALSPIDLIPDFIPVLGYLDEAILLPIAIMLAIRLVPKEVLAEHREAALQAEARLVSQVGAAVIVSIWCGTAALLVWWFWPGSLL